MSCIIGCVGPGRSSGGVLSVRVALPSRPVKLGCGGLLRRGAKRCRTQTRHFSPTGCFQTHKNFQSQPLYAPGPNIWFTTCTNIGFLPPRLRCRKATMHPSAVVQNLQTQISPFQSILRAKDRVERQTKRIAYLFSRHSSSFRG